MLLLEHAHRLAALLRLGTLTDVHLVLPAAALLLETKRHLLLELLREAREVREIECEGRAQLKGQPKVG